MHTHPWSRGARLVLATVSLSLLLAACGDKPETMVASARDYLAKSDPKAAIIQIKNALQENPDLPEARLLYGQALLQTGDATGAETELRKALALNHPPEQVVPLLARALLAQGQAKKLVDEFGATTLAQPAAQATLKTALASAHSALGKADLSKQALDAALAADPTYGPAVLVRARLKAQARDYAGALADVEAALAKNPKDAEAWKLKGDVQWFAENDNTKALESYRKALEAKPDFADAHGAVLTALLRDNKLDEAAKQVEALRKAAPNTLHAYFFDAMVPYQKRDLKTAREKGQQLARVAGNSARALQLAGAIELETGSLLQADALLTRALSLDPEARLTRRLLASAQMRAGQSTKAMATIAPLLKVDNLDAGTSAVVGEVLLQSGDAKGAEAYFAKASKLDPKNEKTKTALALSQLAGGREEAGLAELQQIAQTETGTTATMALISAHLRRSEFDKALRVIDQLEKKQPNNAMPANLRGRTLLARKDVAGARKAFERSLEINPTYFASVASLAAMDMADKKPEEARKRFEAVLAKEPKNGQALLAMAELSARTGGSKDDVVAQLNKAVEANPTERQPRLLLIDYLLRQKDSKAAVSAAQAAVAALADSPELLDALGRAQLAAGDLNQALTAFNKVAALQPLSPAPQMRLADVYIANKNKDAAAQSLRKALAIKPDLLPAQRGLIALALDSQNYDEALRIARGLQKSAPTDAVGFQYEGDVLVAQKKWDAAVSAYNAGIKATGNPLLATRVHNALVSGGKTADADRFAAAWLRDKPKDVVFRMYQGERANLRGDFASAEKTYLNVLQLDPRNGVALNNLAWAMGRLKKDGAIAYAEKAVALAPQQPAFIDTLAELHSEKGDYAKALELQTRVMSLAPGNGLFRLNLAKIHIKGGKKDLARKELDELAKLGDKFPAHAEVSKLLKEL